MKQLMLSIPIAFVNELAGLFSQGPVKRNMFRHSTGPSLKPGPFNRPEKEAVDMAALVKSYAGTFRKKKGERGVEPVP